MINCLEKQKVSNSVVINKHVLHFFQNEASCLQLNIYAYKTHFCPLPNKRVQTPPSYRGQVRGPSGQCLFSQRHLPSSPEMFPASGSDAGGQAGSPSEKERVPPKLPPHLGLSCSCEDLAELSGTPHFCSLLHHPSLKHKSQVGGDVGDWSGVGSVRWLLSLEDPPELMSLRL